MVLFVTMPRVPPPASDILFALPAFATVLAHTPCVIFDNISKWALGAAFCASIDMWCYVAVDALPGPEVPTLFILMEVATGYDPFDRSSVRCLEARRHSSAEPGALCLV